MLLRAYGTRPATTEVERRPLVKQRPERSVDHAFSADRSGTEASGFHLWWSRAQRGMNVYCLRNIHKQQRFPIGLLSIEFDYS